MKVAFPFRLFRRGPLALAGLAVAVLFAVVPAWGQEKGEAKKAEPPAAAPAAEKAPAAVAAEDKPQENAFLFYYRIAGWIGKLIVALSIWMVAMVFQLYRDLQQVKAMPPALVQQAEGLIDAKDFGGVYNLLKEDPSFFARCVTAGLPELQNGMEAASEACDRHADAMTVDMERKISMLAVLGTLGPMIGLLGTLQGMISSFTVIARSNQGLDPGKVAEGISEALVLTLLGVALSLPAIYFFTYFKNRVQSIAANTTLAAHAFLRKFYAAYKARKA